MHGFVSRSTPCIEAYRFPAAAASMATSARCRSPVRRSEGKPIGLIALRQSMLRWPQAESAVHGTIRSLYALYLNTQGTLGN
jgi:hypothetical protein